MLASFKARKIFTSPFSKISLHLKSGVIASPVYPTVIEVNLIDWGSIHGQYDQMTHYLDTSRSEPYPAGLHTCEKPDKASHPHTGNPTISGCLSFNIKLFL